MKHWLMKSEPEEFSIDDLKARPGRKEPWDGVRNYQARNMMRDEMRKGDQVFFYHSNCAVPGIAGIARVVKEAYPDPTAFDPHDKHYDPKSDPKDPRWFVVEVGFVKKFPRTITLTELRKHAAALEGFALLRKGNRLSVMPVHEAHWNYVLSLL